MKNFNFFEKLWEHSRTLRRVGLVLVMCLITITQAWGYGSSAGTVVYFDMQDCSGFGTPYFRVGRTTALSRSYQLSLVGGTKYLYSYPLGQWDNYDAFSVANGKGWTGDDGNSTIYQPHSGQYENGNNKTGYDGDKIITKQTTFMSENISGNYYIKIGSATGSLSYNCQYYDRTNASLPTYSISYDAPSNGTLTVQQYTGSTYTALASGTTGLKPTQIIKVTTSPSTHYGLASLTVTGATQIDGGDTYYITGNCTVTATFAPKWTIKGGNSNDTDDSDAMGNWATYNNLTYTGTANTYSGTITLAANTTYRFKVVDRDNGTPVYWGYGGSDAYHLTFLGQSGASEALGTNSSNQENLALMSAGAGTYTFTWNSSSHTLTVDFPTVTHPSTDYIYYKDYDNYDSHGDIVAHVWGGSTASTGDQRMPVVNSFNFDGTTYFYAALGNNTRAIFAGSDNTATYKTEDLNSASSKKGKYYDKSSNSSESTRWQPFTATLTLDHQGPGNSPSPNSVAVTYGASTNINTSVISTAPTKTGYTFGGYYESPGGVGAQIIGTDKKIPSNLAGYTSSGNWIKTGSSVSATIYAKWTQTVTLKKNGGSTDGSVVATFNGTMATPTAPVFPGYTADGYYAEEGCSTYVMASDGTLQSGVDSWTNGSGKWIKTGSSVKLYAKWKINAPTITCSRNIITISTVAAGTTIYYTTDGSTPTTTSSVYDPSNKPTIAANTTVKAFATKSGCSNSDVTVESLTYVTPFTISYDANLDGAGGTTADQTNNFTGDQVATSACGFSKSGYKFKWWNTKDDGMGEDFYVGEKVTIASADVTLYAVWETVGSGYAFWCGEDVTKNSYADVAGNGCTMRLTSTGVDNNKDLTDGTTYVNKYNSTTEKHAKVLAIDTKNTKYLTVEFTDGSAINSLELGVCNKGGTNEMLVIYSTTSDFSSGVGEKVAKNTSKYTQATKAVIDFSPSTSDKYKYARVYMQLDGDGVYGQTGGSANIIRIYSIKAQAGSSCSAPAAPTISGTADYIVGQTLTLTADISGSNHDASTTYTWYKGANWATASASSPVQAAAVAGSNGHIFTKTAAVGDAGTYWCEASNGTGCESHNSTGKAVTVVYKVTYAANGGTGDAMANSTGTSITLSANSYTAPSGYTFDGWRTVSDKQASGTDYAAGTSSITANLDLYAMWKQTVTLDDNGGTKDGSAVVYYNASSASTPTAPTYSGYTADGYYAEPGCTNLVMSTAGALTNCTGYVSGGKWVHSGATTLYAHYKCTAPTISCTDNVVTMSTTSTGATIYYTYTTDGSTPSDPTSSDNEYDSENKPVITKDTQFKAIAIESGKTNSAVTPQSCTYTAFSTSVNIEKWVLDNRKSAFSGLTTALTAANIAYQLTTGDKKTELDSLDDSKADCYRNYAYLGLKIKNTNDSVKINLPAGKALNVKFGYIKDSVRVLINGVRTDSIKNATTASSRTYTIAASGVNRVVKLVATTGNAAVIQQIMIGEDIKAVTLPAKISLGSPEHGTISVASAKVNVGSTVTVTATPASGYELETLTYTNCSGTTNINTTTKQFTMPNGNVTINATFVLSGHSVTAATSTGDDTYGTVSAAAATVAEGGTTVITATPATGYKVTNWAVEGAGASIDPSGASNSNTTTLTMGSADATVTVTFGPKTYALTLDKNGGSANGSASITWNQRLVTFDSHATAPNASFSLDGYYTAAEGGTKIINGAGSEYITNEYVSGWTTNTNPASWAHDDDATLYAHWRRAINLNANWDYHGEYLNYGSVMVILGGAPFSYDAAEGESGYTLQGYYTEVLGGTKVFNADGTYAADDVDGFIEDGKWIYTTEGTLSLYAHWAKQYTVTYDGNEATSGSAPSATSAFFGDDVTVANQGTLVKTGYSFVGWNTAAAGTGSFYAAGSTFTLTGNMTLYAQWEDCGGGSPTTITIGDFETSKHDKSNHKPDDRGKYLYGYTNPSSKIAANAVTLTQTNNSSAAANSGADYLLLYSQDLYIYADNTTTGDTPASFEDITSISIKIKNYNTTSFSSFSILVGETTVADNVSLTSTENTYQTKTYNSLSNLDGIVKIVNHGSGSTNYNFYIDDITITYGSSGGSCTTHTISFANMDDFAGSSILPSEIEDVYTGAKIAEPVRPTASGYAFAGWYKEGACSNKWDFATDVVDDDITLYAKWVSLTEQYTFHMGDGDISNHSWNVTTFTPTGYYENQAISNFEIPNQDRYPSFFVGYQGEFVEDELYVDDGYSKMREWDDYYNMGSYQSGYIKIQGNASPISDGNTKTAVGAKGTLQMSSSTHSENWGLVFIPDGFGLTISYEEDETPKTLIVPLRQTDNEKVWETESFTTAKGNALTAAQIAGTFKVGLATATPNVYVDCYQTTEEAASAINARKLVAAYGGADMAAGASGRFQIIMSSNTSLPNFGLRWVPLENHTKQSGSWDGMGVSYTLSDKWSLEHAPTIEEDVYIEHYTGITNDAQANSVYINKSTAYMNLTISSIGSLLVMNDIKAKMADDDAYRATTENDINIETDYIYNGSLITAKKSTDTKASYRFCTKAYKVDGYGYINQFIGIPFTEMDAFQLYGSLLYQYDKDANKWVTCSQNMEAYHAYNILRRSTEGRAVFDLDGTLILPGIEAGNKEKVLECNSGRSAEASSWRGEHLFANSWTAPIEIGAMTEGDFHDVDPTIYIFNAGSVNTATDDQKEEYDLGDNPGQWTALPVNDVKEHPENYSYKVIPAMQAFSIRATAANGTLTLDYKKHVYDPIMANSGVVDHTALRAPKQTVEPSVRLRMVVTGENHYKDETQIHERADFSNGHDAGWDGYKIFGNAHSPQLYTVSDNKQLSVNAIPDMEGTVVGFEKGSDDNVYTFSFKYDGEDIWYLNDLKEQTSTLINNENTYIFSAESGDAATRFIISATPIMKVTTGVENVQGDDVQGTKVHKVLINDHIYIIRGGRMYDATGKMLK